MTDYNGYTVSVESDEGKTIRFTIANGELEYNFVGGPNSDGDAIEVEFVNAKVGSEHVILGNVPEGVWDKALENDPIAEYAIRKVGNPNTEKEHGRRAT